MVACIGYLSQETLQNPWIVRVGNPQFFLWHYQGYPRNRQRVPAESSKAVRGIMKGCLWNRQKLSAESSNRVHGFVEGHQHSHNRQRHHGIVLYS